MNPAMKQYKLLLWEHVKKDFQQVKDRSVEPHQRLSDRAQSSKGGGDGISIPEFSNIGNNGLAFARQKLNAYSKALDFMRPLDCYEYG